MDPKRLEELKRRFYNGECSPEELRLLEKWMGELPDNEDAELPDKQEEEQLEKTLWNSIQQKISVPQKPVPIAGTEAVEEERSVRPGAIAAAISFLIISTVAGYWYFSQQQPPATHWITVTTKRGVDEVVLPDSSTVWLNAATTLRYPSSFKDTREVELTEGEAFFNVKPDPSRPFIVTSALLRTEVLGTSFAVKAYRSLPVIKVKVASGKVRVRDSLRVLDHLTPNEQLTYESATGRFQKEPINADEIMGWRSHQLVFYHASFQEIVLAVENRYQVKVDYNPADVAHIQLTFKTSSDWSLTQVLDMLATLSNAQYSIDQERVTIQLNP